MADIVDDAKTMIFELIKEYINNTLIKNEDLLARNLTQIDDRKNSIYFYDYDEIPSQLDVLNTTQDLPKLPKFNFSKDSLDEIKLILIVIGDAEKNEIRLLKNFSRLSLIKRDSKALGLTEDNQRLVVMEKDVLRISGSFEFMKIENKIFLVNDKALGLLQRDYGFDKIIRQKADIHIAQIQKSGLLANINDIKDVAEDLKFARKIMNIKASSKVLQLKPQLVVEFATRHPLLSKKLKFNGTKTKLVLNTKVSKRLFLQLLNDDFLKSELTNLYYFTENKDTIEDIAEVV